MLQTVRSIKIPSNPSSLFLGKAQKLYLYLNLLTPDWQTDSHQTMIQNIKIPSNPSALFLGEVQDLYLFEPPIVQSRHSVQGISKFHQTHQHISLAKYKPQNPLIARSRQSDRLYKLSKFHQHISGKVQMLCIYSSL